MGRRQHAGTQEPPPATSPSHGCPADPSDRLSGWKEIATFLGKGVRTVQRWERRLGLPVHRIGRPGGDTVFASRSEIVRWQAATARRRAEAAAAVSPVGAGPASSQGTPPAGPSASPPRAVRRAALCAAVAALTLAVLLLAW